jgi:hypothetical protein
MPGPENGARKSRKKKRNRIIRKKFFHFGPLNLQLSRTPELSVSKPVYSIQWWTYKWEGARRHWFHDQALHRFWRSGLTNFHFTKCMTKMENFSGSRKVAHILKVWSLLSTRILISSRSVENSSVMSHSPAAPPVFTNSAQIFFPKL